MYAQHSSLSGDVKNESDEALVYATVALLSPKDSALVLFEVSNVDGHFEMKHIEAGKYIFQVAYLGYWNHSQEITVPLTTENMGKIILKSKAIHLKQAEVSAERVPITLKHDTIEYNSAYFKTNVDAPVEALLKKLPGIEVDRAGNIKAQGENVKNVLVDGKEFFSSDPKIATKNIPADAISKVQVYDKKTEESEFSGIQDGKQDKTINLLLKEDKKNLWLGDVLAGGGTAEHYKASGKAFHFNKSSQFAALGMLNNINEFGFSFQDYLDFNGGFQNAMNGGDGARITFENDGSLPINFGQQINGLNTSAAGGINYSFDAKEGSRFTFSYLGNQVDKKLREISTTQNFNLNESFYSAEKLNNRDKNSGHTLNGSWKINGNKKYQVLVNGTVGLTQGVNNSELESNNSLNNLLVSTLQNETSSTSLGYNAKFNCSYLYKLSSKWKLLKLNAELSASKKQNEAYRNNLTEYLFIAESGIDRRKQESMKEVFQPKINASITRELSKQWRWVTEIAGGIEKESLKRKQKNTLTVETLIDSLSPDLTAIYSYIKPGISFKKNTGEKQFIVTLQFEQSVLQSDLKNELKVTRSLFYFTPRISWENEYKSGYRIRAYYESYINKPDAQQLLPVTENTTPTLQYYGNQNLKPEYVHRAQANWIAFDQFSFTSLFAALSGTYTKDKINWSRSIDSSLNQQLTLQNVADDYQAEALVDFSTPIRKLGITVHLSPKEKWNRGINYINSEINRTTNFIHELDGSIENRKKDRWDISLGAKIEYTNARYSIEKKLNKNFFNVTYYSAISYTPTAKWELSCSADISQYGGQAFAGTTTIPILKAKLARTFLKSNRITLAVEVFDLLNKNNGLSRVSEYNYLQERSSNSIGRYILLSFKYRINKMKASDEVNVKIDKR
jgi:Outer membrane protein beta-barrel family/CarboxypepD_reg-like domain